jgi:hypothetical protein
MGKREGIEWHLVRTGGQHFNRQAEQMIRKLKKQYREASKARDTLTKSCAHFYRRLPK